MQVKKNILIIFQKNRDEEIQLGIDMALATSAYDVNLSILFQDEAIQLLQQQSHDSLLQKQIKAWPLYDINTFYVAETALTQYSLKKENIILPITLLNPIKITALIQKQSILLNY